MLAIQFMQCKLNISLYVFCVFCRKVVEFTVPLDTDEAHHGLQKGSRLHAKEWPLTNTQPRSQIYPGSPQAAIQSQCCVLYFCFFFFFNDR